MKDRLVSKETVALLVGVREKSKVIKLIDKVVCPRSGMAPERLATVKYSEKG